MVTNISYNELCDREQNPYCDPMITWYDKIAYYVENAGCQDVFDGDEFTGIKCVSADLGDFLSYYFASSYVELNRGLQLLNSLEKPCSFWEDAQSCINKKIRIYQNGNSKVIFNVPFVFADGMAIAGLFSISVFVGKDLFKTLISAFRKKVLMPKVINMGNGYLAEAGIRNVKITRPMGDNFIIEKSVWNELKRTGNVNAKAMDAISRELSLRELNGMGGNIYIHDRSARGINYSLRQKGLDDVYTMINRSLSENPGGKIVKVRIVGDGDGFLASGIKKKFSGSVDVKQVSLMPASKSNASAYSKQIVADVESMDVMPWSDAEILVDFHGAAFWSKNKLDIIAKEINSIEVGGEGVFITKNKLLTELMSYKRKGRLKTASIVIDANRSEVKDSYHIRFGEVKLDGFHINLRLTRSPSRKPTITLHVLKNRDEVLTGEKLKKLLESHL